MSRFLKRIGTTPMKFQFEVNVTKLKFSASLSLPLTIKWVRGPRTVLTEEVSEQDGFFKWDKTMTLISTLYQEKNGKFLKKKSKIVVFHKTDSGGKALGFVEIDLAAFASPMTETHNIEVPLKKCSDKRAKLCFSITCKWLKELQGADLDTASMMTDMSNLDVMTNIGGDENYMDEPLFDIPDGGLGPVGTSPQPSPRGDGPPRSVSSANATLIASQKKEISNLILAVKKSEKLSTEQQQKVQQLTLKVGEKEKEIQRLKETLSETEAASKLTGVRLELSETTNEEMKQQLDVLQKQLDSLASEKQETKEHNEEMGKKLEKFKDFESLQSEWENDLKRKDETIDRLKQEMIELKAFEDKVSDLEKQLEYETQMAERLKSQKEHIISSHRKELASLGSEKDRWRDQKKMVDDELYEVRKQLEDLEEKYASVLEEKSNLGSQISDWETKYEKSQSNERDWEEKYAKLESNAVSKETKLTDQIEKLQQECAEAKHKASTAAATAAATAAVAVSSTAAVRASDMVEKEVLTKLEKEMEDLVSEHAQEILKYEDMLAVEQRRMASTKEEMSAVSDESRRIQRLLEEEKVTSSQLRTDVQKLNTSKRLLMKELSFEKQKARDLSTQIDDIQQQLDTEKLLRSTAESRATEALSTLQSDTKRFNAVKNELQMQLTSQSATSQKRIVSLMEELESLKSRVNMKENTEIGRSKAVELSEMTQSGQEDKEDNTEVTDGEEIPTSRMKQLNKALEMEVKRLNKVKENHVKTISDLDSQLMVLRSTLQSERNEMEHTIRSAVDSKEKEISLWKENLDIKSGEAEVLVRDLKEIQTDLKDAEASIQILQEENSTLKAQIQGLQHSPSLEQYFSLRTASGDDVDIPDIQEMGQLAELKYLQELNQKLKEHWVSLYGKTVFVGDNGEVLHVLDGNLSHLDMNAIHDQYEDKMAFYEQQLEDSEETLLSAKTAWHATNQILQDQVRELESEVAELKVQLVATKETITAMEVEHTRMQRHVSKAKQKVEKMSEYMNRCEVELVQKKVELVNAVDALSNLEFENHKLKEVVEKQKKKIIASDHHRSASAAVPTDGSSETTAAHSNMNQKGQKQEDIEADTQNEMDLVSKARQNAPGAGLTSASFSTDS